MTLSRRDCLRVGLAAGVATLAPLTVIAGATSAPLRVGLWGCDRRALALAVSALRCAPDVELVAIADLDAARVAQAAAWWRHPAHRPSLRARVRIDDGAVLSGPAAAIALAALPSVDVVLMADGIGAPVCVMAQRHVCLWRGSTEPAQLASLRRAIEIATAHARVLSVHGPQAEMAGSHSGADLRARTLTRFFEAIRQGRSGDADGRVAALLATASIGLA